jgi:hypothetical protein
MVATFAFHEAEVEPGDTFLFFLLSCFPNCQSVISVLATAEPVQGEGG